MADILKLWQAPHASNNTAFTFIVEHLAGAVIGQWKWKTARCYVPLSNAMSISDEAFMLLVLENQYELWMDAESTRVGRGRYTNNVPNKKYCGWSNKGMRCFNMLNAKVRNNWNKQYSKEVEDATTRTLAERYQTLMAVRGRNSHKASCSRLWWWSQPRRGWWFNICRGWADSTGQCNCNCHGLKACSKKVTM